MNIKLLKTKFLVYFILILIQYKAIANNPIEIPPIDTHLGARPLGMGNAFVGVADDENALFDNPAGIGYTDHRNKSKSIVKNASFPDITISTNAYTAGLINDYFNSYQFPSNIIGQSVADANKNQVVFVRASLFPNLVIGHFQIGYLADSYISGYTTDLNSPKTSAYSTSSNPLTYDRTFTVFNQDQYGPVAGFSLPLLKNLIIGFGTRFMVRETVSNTIEGNSNGLITQSSQNAESSLNHTDGLAFDSGILIPFQNSWNPKIGISFLDMGDTIYNATNSSSVNEIVRMNTRAGFSINPNLGKNVGALISIEEERINDPRVNDRDKIRAGCELSFGSYTGADAPVSIRAGYGMQTFSAGISLNIIFATLDVATYGETVPLSNGSITDRRYVARLTVDLLN
ncbi:hypothetical protein [Silvanigrella aquatica]|uniref:Uncharacterized protein n=1 Tax=Silvanigrella aquatica TaxID=1915309 RepID=A0A1L4CWV4_9BACT|nr:hypothetical protein [Silvanigrella aquatica]APJ02424.1 hypothetical protein AXG55_00115 [Silvanigrella aquatica]